MVDVLRAATRWIFGGFLLVAGLSHLLWARSEFQAQVPGWVPVDADLVVLVSGVVEIALGLALWFVRERRALVGWIVAAFLIAIFPGNIAQYTSGTDAFGLDSDQARLTRLFFQPVLILAALWCTGAWPRRSRERVA